MNLRSDLEIVWAKNQCRIHGKLARIEIKRFQVKGTAAPRASPITPGSFLCGLFQICSIPFAGNRQRVLQGSGQRNRQAADSERAAAARVEESATFSGRRLWVERKGQGCGDHECKADCLPRRGR